MFDKLKLWFKSDVIEFYCHPNFEGVLPTPIQASKVIPDWWKRLSPTFPEKDPFGSDSMTAKKCMPLLDVMALGYIIPLQGDVQVITSPDGSIIKAINPPELKVAEFHNIDQVGGKKNAPGAPTQPIKFINHWVIKTAPGWSSLFIPPVNHMNPLFTCLGGMVDTDTYAKEVNFPAIWHEKNFDGKLKAGTPLVQVIPIQRNSFPKKPVVRGMSTAEFAEIERIRKCQMSRASYYSKELREPRP
jgi:hypothetical protein